MADKVVKFTEEARIEFHKATCFMQFSGKEAEFWEDTNTQLTMILKLPEAFQLRYKNVRIIALNNFNYTIHYVIKPYGILVYRF